MFLAQIPENRELQNSFRCENDCLPHILNISKKNSLSCDSESRNIKQEEAYYITWVPESHPPDYWDGLFSQIHGRLKEKYPQIRQ